MSLVSSLGKDQVTPVLDFNGSGSLGPLKDDLDRYHRISDESILGGFAACMWEVATGLSLRYRINGY